MLIYLGVHKRRQEDLEVIAGIQSWFELVAVLEVADNLTDLKSIIEMLPEYFRVLLLVTGQVTMKDRHISIGKTGQPGSSSNLGMFYPD